MAPRDATVEVRARLYGEPPAVQVSRGLVCEVVRERRRKPPPANPCIFDSANAEFHHGSSMFHRGSGLSLRER